MIDEKLVKTEELRHICVPFSPEVRNIHLVDNCYGSDATCALTHVKTTVSLKMSFIAYKACIFGHNQLYLPALLNCFFALGNFGKPVINNSPHGWCENFDLDTHGKESPGRKNQKQATRVR